MSKLIWDKVGEKLFETGVKQGVLYVKATNGAYPLGVVWNGLTAVTESPSGAEPTPIYADDQKYLNLMSAEEFGATIEAYTYPDAFEVCDGSASLSAGVKIGQQTRKSFGLAYKTAIGNDINGVDYGYKLHIIYGSLASPSEKGYQTLNDSPEAITFSWEITSTPVEVPGFKPTATLIIDSTKESAEDMLTLENILFGTTEADPRLPLPAEIAAIFTGSAPSALALSTIVPADDATAIAINSDIVITFNNQITKESIIVTSELGELVAGTKSFDATGKILTFNPAVDLTNSTVYIVAVAGVVDIYNQTLAPTVKNFTTVA